MAEEPIDDNQLTVPFTVYDPVTREVYGSGYASKANAMLQAFDGRKVLIGKALDAKTQRMNTAGTDGVPYQQILPITSQSVNIERDRRISLGFKFPFPSGKIFQLSIPNISAAMSSATAAIVNGAQDGELRWYDPDNDFQWIAMDNTVLTMDARTTIMFGQTATAYNSALMNAGRAIKNRLLAGETLNITDDSLWPAQTG